jgi:DNA-binding transcriptional LysR family regulator
MPSASRSTGRDNASSTAGNRFVIDKLEITHLRTLAALGRHASLSEAAEALGVSQQAISLQLKRLREILGDPLFVRTGHGMAPTPYARLIEPHVQGVLARLKDIPLPDSLTPDRIERTLVISATDYTQRVIVGPLLRDLRSSAPGVRMLVADIEASSLTRKMHHGEIDLTFTSSGYVAPGLVSEPLFVERYACVSANPALRRNEPLPLEVLVQHDFIITSPGLPNFKGSADAWFERQGLVRKVAVSVPSFFMMQEYLRQSNLVGFLPSRLLPVQGLFEIALASDPPGYQVVAAYHPAAQHDPFMTWLLGRVRKLLPGAS